MAARRLVGLHHVGAAVSLRPYQTEAIEQLRNAYREGYRAPILCAPTGSGKTHTAATIIRSAVSRGHTVWFMAHLREILTATSAKLTAEGIAHSFIMANRQCDPFSQVQVVSVQTAARRLGMHRKPNLIVIDEAHLAVANTYRQVIEDCGSPLLLHLTATPVRLDGRGMREVADTIVQTCGTQDLIDMGMLVPIRYFAPSKPDLTGVATIAGDYAQGQLSTAMNKPTITGDAVSHYRKLAHGRPTVVFCTSVKHAEDTAAMFNGAGYRAVAISGSSDQTDRDAALVDLAAGRIDVVVNCQLWVAGVDCPAVSCIILLAPTKSVTKYLQSVGRGLRLHQGKTDCIVLDHAGNALHHGLPAEAREWSLDGVKKRTRSAEAVEAVRQCERCYFVYTPAPVCPNCGHAHVAKPKVVAQTEGELAEITAIKREKRQEVGRASTVEELKKIAEQRGYKMGWVWQQLRIKSSRMLNR